MSRRVKALEVFRAKPRARLNANLIAEAIGERAYAARGISNALQSLEQEGHIERLTNLDCRRAIPTYYRLKEQANG
jgi:DNA-binding MarR family transcriptional regulator